MADPAPPSETAADRARPAWARGLLDDLAGVVGARGLVTDAEGLAPHVVDWRRLYHGRPLALVRPADIDQAAAVVRLCREAGCPIVPQGGHTGLAGGATPDDSGRQVIVSLARMNRVREIDPTGHTITVEAGAILADIQEAADAAGFLFPLSLGAEGSCQIGGNLAANAGGNAVLRYGNIRDLTLGLEVVLPDGRIWRNLRGLRKDNTGYDLKQLFIGSEGTLGLITAAVLKLFPRWARSETAFLAFDSIDAVLSLFAAARRHVGDALVAFELMPRIGIDLALARVEGSADPLGRAYPWYALVQVAGCDPGSSLRDSLEALLGDALQDDTVLDGVVAAGEEQARRLWFLREAIVEGQRLDGASVKHDVSVRIGRMAAFIAEATRRVGLADPGDRVVAFGHVGDGNVHFNVCQPVGADPADFLARASSISRIVYDTVADFSGSISAEHGIGRLKRADLARHMPSVDLALMRTIKQALDPDNVMNPNVLLPPDHEPSNDD